MSPKKVIICDDESDARQLIREYLIEFPQFQIIKECTNGLEAVQEINQLEPDLIFLDIQMPGLSGFQVLQKIVHIPELIFSTAFDNYALKAFDNNAVDYLLKPYTKERFRQAINKVLLHPSAPFDSIRKLSDELQTSYSPYPERVLLENGNRLTALPVNEIIWIEADGDYTRLHTTKKFYLSGYGMNELEQKLNPRQFARVHRGAIVNINAVKEVFKDSNGYYVLLTNDVSQKIGRTYVEVIKKLTL